MLWLIEPLSFAFMRHAISIGFFSGILSAVVGSYLTPVRVKTVLSIILRSNGTFSQRENQVFSLSRTQVI